VYVKVGVPSDATKVWLRVGDEESVLVGVEVCVWVFVAMLVIVFTTVAEPV
jgi:hypothetical protein